MLELWFDFSCPYAYLASRRAPHLARAAGVELAWKPMLLGGVFRGIGSGDGPMATLSPQKAAHNARDMHRWAELLGAPFQIPAAHPMRTVRALRTLLGLPYSRWPPAIEAIYAAYWQRAEDITQDAVIAAALAGAGVPDADISAALAGADDKKAELHARTEEAIELGIFGAPAWVVRRERRGALRDRPILLWGQDRMEWVMAVLAGWDPDLDPPPGGPRPLRVASPFHSPSLLEAYVDVASPFAYLGLTQLPALAEATGATVRVRPVLLGALFREIGQVDVPMFAMPAAKQRYVGAEMQRWARWWGVPFDMPRKFPQRTVTAQRLILLARDHHADVRLALALGRAMWAEQRDLEDAATLRGVLQDCALPVEWLERTQEPAVKQALADETAAAKAAGVFGVPTWVVDGQLFWGQDRLELVLRALGGWKPACG